MKKYISISITFCFIMLFTSGLALYFAPSCKTAQKIGWSFLFIGKESWEAVHIVFAVLFLITMATHLILNWKIFVLYFFDREKNILNIKAAILCAAAAILFFLMSVFNIPPVSWLHKAHEIIKFSWGPSCDGKRHLNKKQIIKNPY